MNATLQQRQEEQDYLRGLASQLASLPEDMTRTLLRYLDHEHNIKPESRRVQANYLRPQRGR